MVRVKNEVLKIVRSNILWGLMSVFLIANIFIIISGSHNKNEIKIINKIVDEVGLDLNNGGLQKLEIYYKELKGEALELARERVNEKNVSLVDILNGRENINKFSEKELEQIFEAVIVENYYYSFVNRDKDYNKLDFFSSAEIAMKNEDISELEKKTYIKGYEKFQQRLDEIKRTGESKFLAIDGNYKMHKKLFNEILGGIGTQSLIIIVILTSFLYNYEFENKTSNVVYSTKKGRNDKDKLIASILMAIVFVTIILFGTLIVYFNVYDYSRVFDSPINSVLNWETNLPHLSWINITLKEFLILNIFIIYIVSIMGVLLTSFISKLAKNTYITFFICGIIYGILFILPDIMRFNLIIQAISTYTPVSIIRGISNSFTMKSTLIPNKFFEITTIVVWIGILSIGYFVSNKRFKKEDI